jgi:DNA-binding CsgD family transcriptional regulator
MRREAMSNVLERHNSLMERIVRDYGALIRAAADNALKGQPGVDDIIAEVHFAVFSTLRRLGDGWSPSRSFVSKVVTNHLNDLLWQRCWDGGGLDAFRKRQAELALQREEMLAHVHTLTPAEFKVFRLLGLGLSNQEIADCLFISPLTVRTHVKRLHAKCDVKGRARLALTAYQLCHRELREGLAVEPGAVDGEPAGYLHSEMLSRQAS